MGRRRPDTDVKGALGGPDATGRPEPTPGPGYAAPQVFLVGAGPGDPELISVRGLRLLEGAEVVLYDRLVDPTLLAHARADAELIYVGKRTADHTVPQDEINQLIVTHARRGKRVVRLKGGDPFVFGRGGEEGVTLHEAGIPFEVVPGITAGIGATAYAGIPVTYRGITTHVTFVTGHEDPLKDGAHLDWDKLASGVGTLVMYMGVKNLPNVVEKLRERGRPAETPVALVRYGTLPKQQTVVGTLADIVEKVAAAKLRPPAITVVGDVVGLRAKLNWFEERPLFGRRVVVTRPRAQALAQIESLRALGAEVVAFPTIRVEPLVGTPQILDMTATLEAYDLVVFTSVNGVECFFDRLREGGRDVRRLHRATVVAIGPKTAGACRQRGLLPDILPATFVAEGVLAALEGKDLAGSRVLLPVALRAREVLPEALAAAGARIDVVPLYDTLPVDHTAEEVADVVDADYVTFTSSSTAQHFAELLRRDGHEEALSRVKAASIGPLTTETVLAEGMQPVLEADEYTVEGLVQALAVHGLGGLV